MKKGSVYFAWIFSLAFLSPVFAQVTSIETGEIHGIIYRRGSLQRVITAQVQVRETNARSTTNRNGQFRFYNLPAGDYTIAVFAAGHRLPEDTIVSVKPNEATEVEVYLDRIEFLFEEVLVTTKRLPPTVSQQSLRSLEIKRLPGTAGDALRALSALPGVTVANDFSGQLYIRDGGPDDNLFYFDRTPLGYPYHLVDWFRRLAPR